MNFRIYRGTKDRSNTYMEYHDSLESMNNAPKMTEKYRCSILGKEFFDPMANRWFPVRFMKEQKINSKSDNLTSSRRIIESVN